MINVLKTLVILLLFSQCKPSIETVNSTFKNENYTYQTRQIKNNSKQIIYIPDLPQSTLREYDLFKTGKANILVIPYLSDNDLLRQKQLDNLQNRKDYYSAILQQSTSDTGVYVTVVAEGLNANLLSQIAFAYPIDHLILINPYKPDIEQCFISNCFNAGNTTVCDSLLQHFQLNDINELQSLLKALQENTVDQQYGLYTLSFWNDIYRYKCDARSNMYKGKLSYIYTDNSGIALAQDSTYTFKAAEFFKHLKKVINN